MRSSPFDHRPLRELGRALREVLGADDNRAFVTRVMREVRAIDVRRFGSDWMEVLGSWAGPGLVAAAAVVAVAVGLTISGTGPAPVERAMAEDVLEPVMEASLLTLAPGPPEVEFFLVTQPQR
jgi:hypothetical protein